MGKKPGDKPANDRHKSGFVVRLPEAHRVVLTALVKKYRRKMTEEVQIALERYYKAEGMPFPPTG